MEDSPAADAGGSGRRTRTLGAEASRRHAVLQRLREVRRGEIRASDAVQVKVDGPIYDTVPDEEYNMFIARRRKEAGDGDLIINDHGLGYVEDWSQRALSAQAKRHLLQQQQSAAAASLSAAAAKTGQQISSMFTSSVFKRPGSDHAKSLVMAADSIVDKIIDEFSPDENDREENDRSPNTIRVRAKCRMEDSPAADSGGSGRRTRTLGAEASRRRAVLQRLREVRRGEIRASDAVQMKVDGPIFDTIPDEEYSMFIARRRKEAVDGDVIINDHGLGYVEDWSQRALPAQAKRHLLQQQQSAKAASLSAAAAKTGQQISSMFTSSVFKRPGSDRAKSLAADSIVDKIIAEFAPDENDCEDRRRRVGMIIDKSLDANEMVRSKNIGNDMAVELKKNDAIWNKCLVLVEVKIADRELTAFILRL